MAEINRRGLMLVLSSPSGAGKTSICRELLSLEENLKMSISATTRPRRPGEVHGVDYSFIDGVQFDKLIKTSALLEYAKVFDYYYGTPRAQVEASLDKGQDVLFDIDWQGADQIKNKKLDYKLITFFILPPSKEVLFERLSKRHANDKLIAEERMKQFERDVLHWINYDYVVINDDIKDCYKRIENLIDAEINNGSKDYDLNFIRNHVEKLTY